MLHCTVLIPQRDAGEAFGRQLPRLCEVLGGLRCSYEVICIDDASAAPTQRALESFVANYACLRVLRFDEPCGVSAALSAGIAAARGELIVAVAAGDAYRMEQVPELMARLARADLVFGRRRLEGLAKIKQRLARIPRWLVLGLEVHDPECLFWAARREAIEGLELARGMFRYLPSLVVLRGFRVSEIRVDFQSPPPKMADARPNPGDLLATWWLSRRWRPRVPYQLQLHETGQPALKIARAAQLPRRLAETAARSVGNRRKSA